MNRYANYGVGRSPVTGRAPRSLAEIGWQSGAVFPMPRMRRARRFLRDLVAFLKSPRCRL